MRNYLALRISLVFLTACGGGGGAGGGSGSTGSTIPVGSVSGTAFDGLILNGTVRVYDFSTGTKGVLLGQATTDSSAGLYSLSLQVESRPVLVEITGGYYVEEAGVSGASTQVSLGSNHKLTALANYTTGTALKVAATTYTHLAAGLAAYNISKGTAVADAINSANTRASSLAGVNILTTTPRQITDVGNASATLTPELKYGFLAGAISMWTLNNTPNTAIARTQPYTSIDFAQLFYQDVSADGLLDGIGLDSTGAPSPLSFGVTPLGVNVYRLGVGAALMQIANHTNNKTGLDGAAINSFTTAYVGNTDAMFGGVTPIPVGAPVVNISSPATNTWGRKSVSIASTTQDTVGLSNVEFLVDGAVVNTSLNLAAQTFLLNTNAYADGLHDLSVRATNLVGLVTTKLIQLKIDNTPPTSTGAYWSNQTSFGVNGTATDNYSGGIAATLLSVPTQPAYGPTVLVGVGGAWSFANYPFVSTTTTSWGRIEFKDAAGNCNVYYKAPNAQFTLLTANACP